MSKLSPPDNHLTFKDYKTKIKKMKFHILTLLITICFFGNSHAQKLEKKAFKDAKVIRLYVSDSSKEEALIRFAKFINKTGFTAFIPEENKELEKEKIRQNNGIIKPTLVPLKQNQGSRQVGDTIRTNMVTLYDVMWGDFDGKLKFYPATDENNNIYIALTGFVWNFNLGGKFSNLQMQKGGKDSNWAQKTLFKQLNEHISEYTNVNSILYSDK